MLVQAIGIHSGAKNAVTMVNVGREFWANPRLPPGDRKIFVPNIEVFCPNLAKGCRIIRGAEFLEEIRYSLLWQISAKIFVYLR